MHTTLRFRSALVLIAALAPLSGRADVRLPALISDNMVLQQKAPASVWGTAGPNEKVAVTIDGKSASTVAGEDGKWSVKLENLKAGGPYEMTIAGSNTITIQNVAVGDVWVCSGQSNMEFKVARAKDAPAETEAAKFPMIRMFTVGLKIANTPQSDCTGKWEVCDPQTVPGFSAVGYFFGREIHQKMKMPVGLIHSSWGGTPAEAWTAKKALEGSPEFKPILDRAEQEAREYPAKKAEYDKQFAAWKAESEKAKAAGQPVPRAPIAPRGPGTPYYLSGLFNGMISPLLPYAIKGTIWYQGESNAARAREYRKLFPAMIQNWREAWGRGDFPFLFVQLANFGNSQPKKTEPADSTWAELREAQTMTLKTPKTAMAVTIDIGEEGDVHPKNKQDVGHRLALAARSMVYGKEEVVASGPMFDSMKVIGNKVHLTFNQVDGGLVAKGGEDLKGFAIAGEDKKFAWADAKIEGRKVVLRADQVNKPVAVRYAWADAPVCNLFNKAGLPAAPFRTDDWESTMALPKPTPTPAETPVAAVAP